MNSSVVHRHCLAIDNIKERLDAFKEDIARYRLTDQEFTDAYSSLIGYDEIKIVSHDENAIHSTPIDNSQKILLLAQGVDVVGIDEAQIFDDEIANVCDELALRGVRVIVAGLDMDFMAKPFGQMPFLMAKTRQHQVAV